MKVSLWRAGVHCLFAWQLLACGRPAHAARYLTVSETQKLCFPEATTFESRTFRFTVEQTSEIERKIGRRLLNTGNRLWIARQNDVVLGIFVLDQVLGKHEMIDYGVALLPDAKVKQVEILEYRESYGGEIRHRRWRDQFRGKSVQNPLRLNRDVQNISGATISCRNVTEGIKRLLVSYEVAWAPLIRPADGMRNSARRP